MRLFLAIEIPDTVKRQISKEIIDFKNQYRDFKWIPEDNFHITVHFFGETNRVEEIKKRLSEILFEADNFTLYSSGLDLFIKNKITIFLHFLRQKKLEKIEEDIRFIYGGGDIREVKFSPHLTLARCRVPSKQQYFVLKKRLEKIETNIEFEVRKLTLFESILNKEKPEYKKVADFLLGQ